MEHGTEGVTIVSRRAEFLCKDVKNTTIGEVEAEQSEMSGQEYEEIKPERNVFPDSRSSPILENSTLDDDTAKESFGTTLDIRYSANRDAKEISTAVYCPDAPPKLNFLCRKYKEFQPRAKEIRSSGITTLPGQLGAKKRKMDGWKIPHIPRARSAVRFVLI